MIARVTSSGTGATGSISADEGVTLLGGRDVNVSAANIDGAGAAMIGAVYDFVGDGISFRFGLSKKPPTAVKFLLVGSVVATATPIVLPLTILGISKLGKSVVAGYNTVVAGTVAYGSTAVTSPDSSPDLSAGVVAGSRLLGISGQHILPRPLVSGLSGVLNTLPDPVQAVIEKEKTEVQNE
jgi:hypothetical protein